MRPYVAALIVLMSPAHARPPSSGGSTAEFTVPENTSLSEVSLRLYGTPEFWPRIARWNRLTPPYALKVGQKLILKQKPRLTPERGDELIRKMWHRKIGERRTVEVARDETLTEIAMRAYGRAGEWKRLAKRNLIGPPYKIWPGQHLILPGSPLLGDEVGRDVVRRMWLRRAVEASRVKARQPLNPEYVELIKQAGADTAPSAFEDGRRLFERGDYEKAVVSLRRSREQNRELLTAWLLEIRALRLLGRVQESRAAAELCIKAHPELKDLPLLRDTPRK